MPIPSEPPPKTIGFLLSDDMIFTSRITGTAQGLGLTIRAVRGVEDMKALTQTHTSSCVILDLSNPGLKIAELIQHLRETCTTMPRLVAYGSHVETATLRAAREAGCDVVLPRSKFVEELPRLLPEWMAPG